MRGPVWYSVGMATEVLKVRVEPKLRRRLERIAEREERSLSDVIRRGLRLYVDATDQTAAVDDEPPEEAAA